MDIRILNPLEIPQWDDMIQTFQDYSFFHTEAWARVLVETYGYHPLYISLYEGRDVQAIVPLMEVRSFLTGNRGVSLPFTDHCEPLMKGAVDFGPISKIMVEKGKERGWQYLELRGGPSWGPDIFGPVDSIMIPGLTGLHDLDPSLKQNAAGLENASQSGGQIVRVTYWGHLLDLAPGEKAVYDSFRSNTRRNVRKAVSAGVEIQFLQDAKAMKAFFRLQALTRRRHGLPPQPWKFFQKMLEWVVAEGRGLIALAVYKGTIVAGAIFLFVGRRFVYKFGASDQRYQKVRANNLIMAEAIQLACRRGFATFDFGRTETHNEGLRRFKKGWNPLEIALQYFRLDLKSGTWHLQDSNSNSRFVSGVFKTMPLAASKFVGRFLYGHMG